MNFCSPIIYSQSLSEPQAGTADEYDAYLDLLSLKDPIALPAAAEEFLHAWPASEFAPLVLRMEVDAYMRQGDQPRAVSAAKRALRQAPDNLDLLAQLAYLIADSSTQPGDLHQARVHAQRVLGLVSTQRIPHTVLPDQWQAIRSGLEETAQIALALVAFKSNNTERAIEHLEAAQALAPNDPLVLYRLGVLYKLAGKADQAKRLLTRAAQSGPDEIRQRARQELERAEAGH